jgi:DNA polymerase-3 subunit delta
MTFQEALKHLNQKHFSPCYLLCGEEPFLVQELLRQFREKALDPTAIDFNYDQLRGEEVDPEEVLLIAKTFPLLSPRRLLIVLNADQIKDDREAFLSYLENPSETTTLVFVAAKPDMRKKLFTTLKKKGVVMTCSPLYDNEVPQWIAQEGRKRALHFSKEALWYLKEHLGNDLFSIQQEIEKVALHLSDAEKKEPSTDTGTSPAGADSFVRLGEKEISSEMVQQVIGDGRSHSIFEFVGAVGEKNVKGAFKILTALLAEGEHPLFILTMLMRQWRMMAIAKEGIQSGKAESVIGKKVPMPPRLLTPFFQQLKGWKSEEIRKAFDLSLAADSQLKGGRQSPSFVMEALILDLCQPPVSRPIKPGYTIPFRAGF